MREEQETAGGTRDSTREWLLQLERRVTDLERENARVHRGRRRAFWYLAIMVILIVLLMNATNILGI